MSEESKVAIGLRGIKVANSTISTVHKDGTGLYYRGYTIEDLAEKSSFEEVAYMLIYGHLPNKDEYKNWVQKLKEGRKIPQDVKNVLAQLPKDANPMAVLQVGVSALGIMEPEEKFQGKEISARLIGALPTILGYWYHTSRGQPVPESEEETIAGYTLHMLTGKKPDPLETQMLNVSLILYAEHGFNASTFTARVVASTLADYYSSITAAIGALSGPLHGGANEKAIRMLLTFNDPEDAKNKIMEMLAQKEKVMGFGHGVYKIADPRHAIIMQWAEKLAQLKQREDLLELAKTVITVMKEEKNLFPNVDFITGVVYYLAGIDIPLYTPIFVIGRSSGWSAHIFEQREDNKLIRPRANYVGPEYQEYIPIDQR